MYLTIIKNGQTIDHRDLGIECLSFEIDSLSPQNQYEALDGRHGLIPLTTTFGGRSMAASFFVEANDHISYQSKKDEIFKLFSTESEMYLIDSRKPNKRWSVKVSSAFTLDNINFRSGRFTVTFLSSASFAESVSSGLQTKSTTSFTISNDGNKVIDPREDSLVITYTGASTNLKITNNTTGDAWQYTGTSAAGNTIKLDGIRSIKNGLSIFRNTNRKLIRLAPGTNSFTLTGTSGSFTISFDFRSKFI